jgi:drug efflux transport system permease protein
MILRIRQMLVKEFLQMFRDPRMRLVILVMPLVQLTVLAFALTTDVKNISTAVVDPDLTVDSRSLVSEFSGGGYFRITHWFTTDKKIRRLMDAGTVRAVIRIPHGFSADLQAGKTVVLQLILDGTLSNDSAITLNYASQAIDTFNRRMAAERVGVSMGASGCAPGPCTTRIWKASITTYPA